MAKREKVTAAEYDRMVAASRPRDASGRFVKAEPEAPTEDPFITEQRAAEPPPPAEPVAKPKKVKPPPAPPPKAKVEEDIEEEAVAGGAAAGMFGGPVGMAVGAGGAAAAWLMSQGKERPRPIGTLEGGSTQLPGDDTMKQLLEVTKQMARLGMPVKDAIMTKAVGSRM